MTFRRLPLALGIVAVHLTCATTMARADPAGSPAQTRDWHDVKCRRYAKAWLEVLAREGRRGLSREFLDRHEAFLASNCTRTSDVCPRSPEELRLANILVIRSMDFGAASTFAPFYCH